MNASVRVFALLVSMLGLVGASSAARAQEGPADDGKAEAADAAPRDPPKDQAPREADAERASAQDLADADAKSAKGDPARFKGVRADERAPRLGTPLIGNRLFPLANRFEVTGSFDMNPFVKYLTFYGGHVGLTYHVFEWLNAEAYGGYLLGDEGNLIAKVRQLGDSHKRPAQGLPCADATCEPEIPDLWQTTWFTGLHGQWAPFYGKLSLASEVDLNFQLYGQLGMAVQGIRRLLNDGSFKDGGVRIAADYGIGLRLIPWEHIAVRIEWINYTGLNPDVVEHTDQAGVNDSQCSEGYTLTVRKPDSNSASGFATEDRCFPDFSSESMFQIGLSFIF